MILRFTIPAVPRTKKTSNRIVSMGKPCWTCKRRPIQRVIPSEAFEKFEAECLTYSMPLRNALERQGVSLPIEDPITLCALFYRDAERGDLTGYMQAIADVLQMPVWKDGKQTRSGMGIILDDSQIASWDGTRLLKDASNPRIEVVITTINPPLFEETK